MRKITIGLSAILALGACGGAAAPSSQVSSSASPGPAAAASASSGYDYGSYDSDYGYGKAATPAPAAVGPLQLGTSAKLGKVLAGPNGLTLYVFSDDKPNASTCYAGCVETWPPLILASGTPTATATLKGTLGIAARTDGGRQVTYNGKPLYTFTGDSKPGDANGDGVSGQWSAVKDP